MDTSRLNDIKLFLFDMDGTLWLGSRLYPFTKELLRTIREAGKRYLFITNNSSRSTADYVKKLASFGIEATGEDFMTSAEATAYYLTKELPEVRFYVCGTASLKAEFSRQGIKMTDNVEDSEGVVLGFDTELDFKKLHDVSRILCTRDVPYYATNPDLVCPTEFGSVPDCGSVSGMLRNVSGKMPIFIGKPSPLMIELAMEKCGVSPLETAVIGDRIYTDVKSGLNAGALAVLVMSGETTEEILRESPDKPDLVLEDAGLLIDRIKSDIPLEVE
ncbi:MAG: HAD-IIA family hydrolase [Clostridia bacterium]|nr:HAD-IIA family hydrolase [Clostridia bacterium]